MTQTLKITSPKTGTTVKGTVVVQVAETNVLQVNFSVDGKFVGTDHSAPFKWTLDTTKLTDGSHSIKAVSGNGKVSSTVKVTVANKVTARLTAAFAAKEV